MSTWRATHRKLAAARGMSIIRCTQHMLLIPDNHAGRHESCVGAEGVRSMRVVHSSQIPPNALPQLCFIVPSKEMVEGGRPAIENSGLDAPLTLI